MTTLHQVSGWESAASFAVWSLAVSGVSQVLFSDLTVVYLRMLLGWMARDRTDEMRNYAARIQLLAGQQPNPSIAMMAGDGEIGELQHRIRELGRPGFLARQLGYLVGCRFCQCVWSAAVSVAVFAEFVSIPDLLATALAYGAASSMLPTGACGPRATCKGK